LNFAKLQEIKHCLSVEQEVAAFIQQVSVPVLNEFAASAYDLMKVGLENKAQIVISNCL